LAHLRDTAQHLSDRPAYVFVVVSFVDVRVQNKAFDIYSVLLSSLSINHTSFIVLGLTQE